MRLPLTTEGSRLLRQLIRQQFAWPGGYEIYFITYDSEVICADCARSNYREIALDRRTRTNTGWLVRWAETADWLDESIHCDQCYRKICAPSEE